MEFYSCICLLKPDSRSSRQQCISNPWCMGHRFVFISNHIIPATEREDLFFHTLYELKWNICDAQHYRPNRNWVHSQRNSTAFQSYCKIPCCISCLAVCRQNYKTNTSASADQARHWRGMYFLSEQDVPQQPVPERWCSHCRGAASDLCRFVFILQVF